MDTSTPPAPPPPAPPRRRWPVWRFVIGGVIVLLGLQWLAASLGWSWRWSIDLWRFWPVVIIFIGLSMMFRGRIVSAVLSVLVGFAIVLLVNSWFFGAPAAHRTATVQSLQTDQLAAATAADLQLKLGAAKIRLAGGSTALVDGSFRSNITSLTTNSVLEGTTQRVTYSMQPMATWQWWRVTNELSLALTEVLPITLHVDTGAADFAADLSNVQVTRAEIDAGASALNLTLGDMVDASQLEIDSGASSIDITVPRTVGVNLRLDTGLSGKTLPDFTSLSKNEYRSTNYDQTSKKLTVRINAGASSIHFHWK